MWNVRTFHMEKGEQDPRGRGPALAAPESAARSQPGLYELFIRAQEALGAAEPFGLSGRVAEEPADAGLALAGGQESCAVVAEPAPAELVRRVREGVPMAEFQSLQDMLGLPEEALAEALGMSRTTLHRRKKAGVLDSAESERVLRLMRVLVRAESVLGAREIAREWLQTPLAELEGESPIQYADTEVGAREVENILGRLEQGVFF